MGVQKMIFGPRRSVYRDVPLWAPPGWVAVLAVLLIAGGWLMLGDARGLVAATFLVPLACLVSGCLRLWRERRAR